MHFVVSWPFQVQDRAKTQELWKALVHLCSSHEAGHLLGLGKSLVDCFSTFTLVGHFSSHIKWITTGNLQRWSVNKISYKKPDSVSHLKVLGDTS